MAALDVAAELAGLLDSERLTAFAAIKDDIDSLDFDGAKQMLGALFPPGLTGLKVYLFRDLVYN